MVLSVLGFPVRVVSVGDTTRPNDQTLRGGECP
ncbi:hypothetical protein AVEN_165946-1, partial [Araneus ventricosus]